MSLKCDEYDKMGVITLGVDLAGDVPVLFSSAVEDYIQHKHIVELVVDFEKTTFVDSEGLEALLNAKKACEDMFGQLKLAGLDENCRKILEITRLEHQFEIHQDIQQAMKMMRQA